MLYYKNSELNIEDVSITTIASKFGTPCYAYSKQAILEAVTYYNDSFEPYFNNDLLICYAVKANSNLSILKLISELGCGFDIVSGGELQRLQHIQANMNKVVFSGTGKKLEEIELALKADIACFNVESVAELHMISAVAVSLNKQAPISIRVNPSIDVKTHPYIATGLKESKFGIDVDQAEYAYKLAMELPNINIVGIDCHIGSQITELAPFLQMLDFLADFIQRLANLGIKLKHVDIGGGLGVNYKDEKIFDLQQLAKAASKKFKDTGLKIIVEPGRSIISQAGALITQVILTKKNYDKDFVVVDAAMNDLLRPALYGSYHKIWHNNLLPKAEIKNVDIVGPVCESGDFLAQNYQLAASQQDILAVASSGAYGAVMGSNYNSRPKITEILVDKDTVKVIRTKETFASMIAQEVVD